jgi:ABC-type glycerol-3-phosphate transport system substrate-binding protein
MSKFQFIILGIFIVFLVGGVVAFATFKGQDAKDQLPPITIWGTFPAETFDLYVSKINITLPQQIRITYTQKRAEEFSQDFISALARGQGPDAILISADTLLPHEDKLALIPYQALPQRTFMDMYVQEANIYLSQTGILGIPFTIDPLVMYWNRDMFDAAGIATYPKHWAEFEVLNQKLTSKDERGNIRKSAIALGEFTNITHAREILGTLMMQTGNGITQRTSEGVAQSLLKSTSANPAAALRFFTDAANPSSPSYSWNKSLPESKTAFLSNTLATYFGFASEISELRNKNPNIDFDVALLPQRQATSLQQAVPVTYGRMYGFSIVHSTPNANAVYQIISILTAPQFLSDFSDSLYLPSVHRAVIAQGSTDPYISIFNQAVLIASTWVDTDPRDSQALFRSLVDAVTSGAKTVEQALRDASDQYDVILAKIRQ